MMNLEKGIEAIKNDQEHGATELADQALEVLRWAIFSLPAQDPRELAQALELTAQTLAEARPTMVAIKNAVAWCLKEIRKELLSLNLGHSDFRPRACSALDEARRQIARGREQAVQKAADLLKPNSKVVTASYSSLVLRTLMAASQRGIPFSLMALASEVGGLAYGKIMKERLKETNIPCFLLSDDEIDKAVHAADMVLLGADAVLPDGSVINGYPSLSLCRKAKEAASPLPVYIVCDPLRYADSFLCPEKGFDLVPSEFVTSIIS